MMTIGLVAGGILLIVVVGFVAVFRRRGRQIMELKQEREQLRLTLGEYERGFRYMAEFNEQNTELSAETREFLAVERAKVDERIKEINEGDVADLFRKHFTQ